MKTNKLISSIYRLSFIAHNTISAEIELLKGKNGISTTGTQMLNSIKTKQK